MPGASVAFILAVFERTRNAANNFKGRKRVIGIIAAILASLHMRKADDLFGGRRAAREATS
jgi:hypothetical protein